MDSFNNHQIVSQGDRPFSTCTTIVSTSKPISGEDIINIRMISGRTITSTTSAATAAQQQGSSTTEEAIVRSATVLNTSGTIDGVLDVTPPLPPSTTVASTSQPLLTTASTRIAKTSKTKFLILGAAKVGKTLILRRMQNINWPLISDTSLYNPTIGPDLHRLKCGNIEAIDIGGRQRYMPIARKYCELFQTFVVVFDLTEMESFTLAKNWLQFIHTHDLIQVKRIILIGNKSDLDNERKVAKNLAKNLAMTYDGDYLEISAKMDLTMDKIIDALEHDDKSDANQSNDK
ncbi:ras-related protein Rab-13 [Dermatophagoides farinae]|uniref:Signal recognition particle receptor beta subunit n=1 Tax=Dermatophagoides farinae TaxID=6954 RepID=A0A922L4G9_DERFA|nr:ras-related protein Rab-1D-like [Dermatophagoides farinae]KAH7644468.1 hypothetical protein HUG17_0006 [Dermatophagoides farinae]KAH9511450.1 Signal recognition particle receptor beta subunit [Dermatophagoides farinae]